MAANVRRERPTLRVGRLALDGVVIATIHYLFLDGQQPAIEGQFMVAVGDPTLESARRYRLELEGGGHTEIEVTGRITRYVPGLGDDEPTLMYLMERRAPLPASPTKRGA